MSGKKFGTLNSLRSEEPDSGGESDGGERDQSFYVGGSEHSGQEVLGNNRGERDDAASRLFRLARQSGAEVVGTSENIPTESARFSGGGVRLGDNVQGPQPVPGAPSTEGGEVDVVMNVYTNGFTIDDGPLRTFDDPESVAFLGQISKGQLPAELIAAHPRRRINMRMERKMEEYKKPKVIAFAGEGARLGSVVPEVVDVEEPPAAPPVTPDEAAKLLAAAQSEVGVNPSEPTTQLQLRLPDGRRLVGSFNHSHTLSVVRCFLVSASPALAFAPFELRTSYPNQPITDETLSLKDAGLLNSALIIRNI